MIMISTFPLEILDLILFLLPKVIAFRCAVNFRRLHVRDVLLPLLERTTPYHACRRGQLELLQWWCNETRWRSNQSSLEEEVAICVEAAASNGNVNIIDWLYRTKYHVVIIEHRDHILRSAARFGHLDVFKWWIRGSLPSKNVDVIDIATASGSLAIVDFVARNFRDPVYSFEGIYFACKAGHLECLKWWEQGVLPLPKFWIRVGSVLKEPWVREWWERNYPDAKGGMVKY